MELFDTHTHLYLQEYEDDNKGVDTVKRAIDAGVRYMVFPNVDLSTIEPMKTLAAQYPDNIRMAMGFHPTEVKEDWEEAVAHITAELEKNIYVAVGEIGIDLYWDKTYIDQQMLAFDRQVEYAENKNLPIIIHCRDGLEQTLEVVQGHKKAKAVFHSFGGTIQDVDKIRNVGDYYFGINGIVTFKNCKVRETLPEITTERLLLETDAPYLSPVPYRGKRNESAYMVNTAQHIADCLNTSLDAIAETTTSNARKFFNM